MPKDRASIPLVYSCSGCSSAAQMANHIALALDRVGAAEMSCIAGVGGDVPSLVKLARSGRPVVAIDGCPLVCAKSCLARHGVEPDMHWQLGEHGVRKRYHAGFDADQAEALVARVAAQAGLLQRKPLPAVADAPASGAGTTAGASAPVLS